MGTVTVNGVALHYEEVGSGPCLVLTHGSWTDGTGWAQVVERLVERYRVVVWDRRGHTRSAVGDGVGSRDEDAADLVGLIEQVSDAPVHLAGSSYGGIVTLTVVTERPDLVVSAAVHEPPLFGLLEGTRDDAVAAELRRSEAELRVVRGLLESRSHEGAARHFIEHVALGPGSWDQLPAPFRAVLVANAPTYLDELRDETALSIDAAALAATTVPIMLSQGTESPPLFAPVIGEVAALVPSAQVEVIEGAGHVPHSTHPDEWVARLTAFHATVAGLRTQRT